VRMLDLFTGIGGFSLAASWVWGNELDLAGFCEQDVYCGKVLKKNFPDVPIYPDIKELRGEWFQDIDLITGGFPCQDISVAGKGAGIDGDRSGLWSELCRIISEVRPRYALIENVPMLIHRGLERVLCDLTEIGYDAEWQVIGADDVGARHKRKRIWIVAYPGHLRGRHDECGDVGLRSGKQAETAIGNASQFEVAGPGKEPEAMAYTQHAGRHDTGTVPHTDERIGDIWTVEPDVGRVANGVSKRVDRLRGLGNAIVPQIAALIMQMIKDDMNL
jgi:DNA (cytosine-5)-methyltransferase 1